MTASNANPPWNRETVPGRSYWLPGLAVALLILGGQILYFEGDKLSKKPIIRLSLERICEQLNCKLPAYENLDEFVILQSSLSALPEHNQLFKATISNRTAFAQPYPNLDLTLLDYSGDPFTHRIFQPQDYLPETLIKLVVQPDASMVISLNIAALKTKVGGYTFKLTD